MDEILDNWREHKVKPGFLFNLGREATSVHMAMQEALQRAKKITGEEHRITRAGEHYYAYPLSHMIKKY